MGSKCLLGHFCFLRFLIGKCMLFYYFLSAKNNDNSFSVEKYCNVF